MFSIGSSNLYDPQPSIFTRNVSGDLYQSRAAAFRAQPDTLAKDVAVAIGKANSKKQHDIRVASLRHEALVNPITDPNEQPNSGGVGTVPNASPVVGGAAALVPISTAIPRISGKRPYSESGSADVSTDTKRARLEQKLDKDVAMLEKLEAYDRHESDYQYVKLGDIRGDEKSVYTWGVVYDDPSRPKQGNNRNPKLYIMTKLVDETVNPGASVQGYVPLTMFFKKTNLYKKIARGRILRIHRADASIFDHGVCLSCDEDMKASWVLFSPYAKDGTVPIAHDKETYSWTADDEDTLKRLRTFARRLQETKTNHGENRVLPVRALPIGSMWRITHRGPDAKKSVYGITNTQSGESRDVYADIILKELARGNDYFRVHGSKVSSSKNRVSILSSMTKAEAELAARLGAQYG